MMNSNDSKEISTSGRVEPGDTLRVSKGIASPWHTALIVGLIAGTSFLGSRHTTMRSMGAHHTANYAFTLAWEWVIAALVYAGLRWRHTPLRQILGERRRGAKELFADVGVAALFWVFAMIVLAIGAVVLKLLHLTGAQQKIAGLAPDSLPQMALWVALSVTAGICEEFIFRGYLQRQFARLTGRLWIGVVASSLLFGCAHGYEGIAGMLLITTYGALFSVLAIRRRSLRAGMIAHAWHDVFTGIALALVKRAHLPLGIFLP